MQKLTSKGKHAVKVGNHPLQMWYPKLATVGLRWQSGGEDSGDLVFHMLHIQKKKKPAMMIIGKYKCRTLEMHL